MWRWKQLMFICYCFVRPKYASMTEEKVIPTTFGVWMGEDYRLSKRRIFLSLNSSSCAVEQFYIRYEFGSSEPTSTEQLEKLAVEDGKLCQRATIETCSAWRWMTVQLPPGSWQCVSLLLQVYLCRLGQFVDVCFIVDCLLRCLYTGSPSRQNIDCCVCNGLMSIEPDKLIGTKLPFQMYHASIWRTMMATFVLDAISVNDAFHNAISNDIVAEHLELWSGVRFCIMDDPVCYELRVISIATGTSVKCYSPKSFSSFKASLELSFSRIMHAHMLQRLFETSVQPNTCNFFLGQLIRRICHLLSKCGI